MAKLLAKVLSNQMKNSKLIIIRNYSREILDCNHVYNKSVFYQNYKRVLVNDIGLSNQDALDELENNKHLLRIPITSIYNRVNLCKTHEIILNDTPINWEFLEMNLEDLENNIRFLKEMGAKRINTTMIISLAKRASMMSFKSFAGIKEEENVAEKLYSYLDKPPPKVKPLKKIDENLSVAKYREECLRHYIQWRFNIPQNNHKMTNNLTRKFKNRSFSFIKNTFNYLHFHLGIPIETLQSYTKIHEVSVQNLKDILENIPTICGVHLLELMKEEPELCSMKFVNTFKISSLLEKFKFSSLQLKLCPKVLLIDSEILETELKIAYNTPQLEIFQDHPKFLQIFLIKDSLQGRINYLNYLNINDTTVQILRQRSKLFEKRIKSILPKIKNQELIGMFERLLKIDSELIKENLEKHPLWQKVNFVTVYHTFQYLKSVVDDEEAIINNMQLLLYHTNKVRSTLTPLIHKNYYTDPKDKYTQSQLLALCAYEIEKQYHFTGDGIWDVGNGNNIDIDSDYFHEHNLVEETEIDNKKKKNLM